MELTVVPSSSEVTNSSLVRDSMVKYSMNICPRSHTWWQSTINCQFSTFYIIFSVLLISISQCYRCFQLHFQLQPIDSANLPEQFATFIGTVAVYQTNFSLLSTAHLSTSSLLRKLGFQIKFSTKKYFLLTTLSIDLIAKLVVEGS